MEKLEKRFCSHCQADTNQTIVFDNLELMTTELVPYNNNNDRDGQSLWTVSGFRWILSQCQGCQHHNFLVTIKIDPTQEGKIACQYPRKLIRDMPYWVSYLNRKYIELFTEVYISLNFGHRSLPLMGLRTLLDMYIIEKIGDVGTFQKKLQKLYDERFISSTSFELLKLALEYGHAAVHRGYKAESEEILGVLDIIENLFKPDALIVQTKNFKKV